MIEVSVQLNYTTVLNGLFLLLAAVLVVRFLRTGGRAMIRMMNEPMDEAGEHRHPHHVVEDGVLPGVDRKDDRVIAGVDRFLDIPLMRAHHSVVAANSDRGQVNVGRSTSEGGRSR